jgi:hypothetical protein
METTARDWKYRRIFDFTNNTQRPSANPPGISTAVAIIIH